MSASYLMALLIFVEIFTLFLIIRLAQKAFRDGQGNGNRGIPRLLRKDREEPSPQVVVKAPESDDEPDVFDFLNGTCQ